MKRLLAIALLALLVPSLAMAQAQEKRAPAKGNETVEQTLTQMEREWANAYVKKDWATVDRIVADDYAAIFGGKDQTKAELMDELKSGFVKYTSITTGKMRVRVFGNAAVVTGSDDEKSSRKDMDTSGHYVWTDVFVNREGRWQVVASQEGEGE
jgi:ketosteroid isomerase-like protein